ncbi:MAG: prolipoprotein diacylglyceryl transferase, partial [Polynucleobacter victoriensis]
MPLMHPQFDPVAISVGPIAIHWYGLMYLLAFAQFLLLGKWRVGQAQYQSQGLDYKYIEDLLFAGVVGVILGGRLGYVIFYMPGHYLANPLDVLKVWEGGMSFHGGFLGVL